MDSLYLGTIFPWPISYAPQAFAFCGGQLMQVGSNQALFSLLGMTWGGDGSSTFALPDLRGRVIVGNTNMSGLPLPGGISYHPFVLNSNANAHLFGAETVTLLATQLPPHTHPTTSSGVGSLNISLPPQTGTGLLAATAQPGSTNIPGTAAVPALIEPLSGSGDTVNAYGAPDNTTTMPVSVTIPASPKPITAAVSGLSLTGGYNTTPNSPVPVMQPYAVMNYLICTNGLYPSRN